MSYAQAAAGLAVVLALASPAVAQPPAPKPAFEVASIKLESNCGGRPRGINQIPTPGRLAIPCTSVQELIQASYIIFAKGDTPDMMLIDVTGGPAWVRSDVYSINAKAEDGTPVGKMIGPMLRALLEDRFQLQAHRETKEGPVYFLTAPNGAAKLKPTAEGSCVPIDMNKLPKPGEPIPKFCGSQNMRGANGRITVNVTGATMKEFAVNMLSNTLDRKVIDKTGLDGRFDLSFEFAPDTSLRGFQGRPANNSTDALPPAPEGPNIFMALDRLGFKLERGKGPVEVLVIDRIEKPSEN
jgi:uncharacterized protein (TIGR03435 family)